MAGFLDAVNPIICQVVPNGTETIETPFWYTVDPAVTRLVTSIYGQGCDLDPVEYMQWELLADDVMKTADVLRNVRGVQTLHEVTDGNPDRSTIYREVMVPHGMAQELLVALRTSTRENWERPAESVAGRAHVLRARDRVHGGGGAAGCRWGPPRAPRR